ncbi:MAG: MFS transporter [Bryobacter sp.]
MPQRARVLILLALLSIVTYLDRMAIAVVGPRMQDELGIGPEAWGWVVGAFSISYALFEIPTGRWGDLYGPRRTLTRIVLWWSAFTAFTGLATNYWVLVATRFLFGAGEAGAFPNAGVAISRWFPLAERGRAMGVFYMSAQGASALAPLLIVPLLQAFGWRMVFFVFGGIGLVWAAVWFWRFRDAPRDMPGISPEEIATIGPPAPAAAHRMPWFALRHRNFLALSWAGSCYMFGLIFFISWLQTYLVRGKGFTEGQLIYSALPPACGVVGNLCGGIFSDYAVRRWGKRWGRRSIALAGHALGVAGLAAAIPASDQNMVLALLGISYFGITMQQTAIGTVLLETAGRHVGAVGGALNMLGNLAGFLALVAYGYLVKFFGGNYNLALTPLVAMMALGAVGWFYCRADQIMEDEAPIPQQAA